MVNDLNFESACDRLQAIAQDYLDKAERLAYIAGEQTTLNLIDPDTNQPLMSLTKEVEREMAKDYQKILLDAAKDLLEVIKHAKSTSQLETQLNTICEVVQQKVSNLNEAHRQIATTKACQSTLFASRPIEPRPNHAAASDLLRILPYPHKWKEYGIELGTAQIIHSKERYVQYELFGMDSTGDFIPITPESAQDIVGSFDWIDHKILSVLLMRSFESGGEKFVLSLNWLADLITDARAAQPPDSSGKRKYLSRKALLEDLERRIKRLRMLFLQVEWHEGIGKKQKIYNLLRQEGIKEIEFALFLVPMIWTERYSGKKQDILAEIEPGRWYQLFCKDIRQFTWIPKELLSLNPHNNWRRYAVGEYILIEYRNNVDNLKEITDPKTKQPIKVLRRQLDTLIREVLTPEEINYALSNRDKGWRLKNGILSDFDFYRSCDWYLGVQFPEGGFQELLAGVIEVAPSPNNAQAIQKVQDSRPEAKKPFNYRKSVATGKLTGKQVEQARKRKKYSRDALAKLIGISANYLGKLEREERPITPELEFELRNHLKF